MTEKTEALRLADRLESDLIRSQTMLDAAAELRRLHTLLEAEQALHQRTTYPELRRLSSENELLHQRHHDDNVEYTRVLTQRDALLEALRVFVSCAYPVSTEIDERGHRWTEAYLDQALPIARAAIAKVEGEKT